MWEVRLPATTASNPDSLGPPSFTLLVNSCLRYSEGATMTKILRLWFAPEVEVKIYIVHAERGLSMDKALLYRGPTRHCKCMAAQAVKVRQNLPCRPTYCLWP